MAGKKLFTQRVFAAAMTVIAMGVLVCQAPSPAQAQVRSDNFRRDNSAPLTPRDAPPPAAKESVRAPVQPAPAESRTPEEAANRAADPKDPSGALIIAPAKDKP